MFKATKSFRFIVVTTIFAMLTLLAASIFAQDVAESIGSVKKDQTLIKVGDDTVNADLFPFLSKADNGGSLFSAELITGTTYLFSASTGAVLEDMSSGTTQLVAASSDDGNSTTQNIGFDFWFDGVRFTQFGANANGFMKLGPAPTGASFTNSIGTTANAPKIMPYWDDLWVGTNGQVHFKVVGSAPTRKLVVEWQNINIPRGVAATAGGGTFQVWLYEAGHTTLPGVVQFVYGNGIIVNSANSGYSVGLQSGAATNFASVTTTGVPAASYAVANNAQTNAITATDTYVFTPNVPAAPTDLTFAPVTAISAQLNWTDVATNEFGYAIYRSTDGVNYSFLTQTAANIALFNDTGLAPSTTYFYRVYAVTEGALSSVLAGSQATAAPGNDTCNGTGGDWSNVATWTDGSVPTNADNVTIGSGCTVTVDVTTAVALSLTIDSGGTLQSPTTGTPTNNLTVSGNVTNNGTLDFSTNGDTASSTLTFGAGGTNVTFGGTGATTDVNTIAVAKGAQATVVDVTLSNFTVRGVNTDIAGYLTLTSGTFKISGTFAGTNRVFTSPTYTIPLLGGIWLNNPNYSVVGQAGGTTTANNGLFRVTQGTYGIGVGAADGMGGGTGATFIIEGGTINATRFDPQSAVTFNMSAGTMNISPTAGNTRSNFGSFELFSSTSSFTMSGGTINLIQAATGATPIDWQVLSATLNVTGGTLNVGTGATATNFNFRLRGNTPNLVIDNTTNNKTASFTAQTLIRGNTTVNTGTTFAINGFLVAPTSTDGTTKTFTNNGTVTGNLTGSRLYFLGTGAGSGHIYTGSGVAGTTAVPLLSVDVDSVSGAAFGGAASNLVTNRVILFTGNVTGAAKLELGSGGASTGTVQIGNTTTATNAGTFDAPFTFNLGSGGQVLIYLRTTNARTTGVEVNPTRIATSLTYDDNDITHALTIAGGDLTASSATTALTLTNGRVVTGANNLIVSNGAATVTRTNGYVDGNFRKAFAAAAVKTFEVGTANGYSPVAVNVTAATFPANFNVKAVQTAQPNIPQPGFALSRYWSLSGDAGITADLTFNYLDPTDIPVTATEANYVIQKYNAGFTQPGGTVNAAGNSASITGVTAFSDWTLAEPAALVANADVTITKTDGVVSVNAGGTLTYTITAGNAGPNPTTGTVADTFPASFTVTGNWTCVGAGGGTCTASGTGNINDAVNLPVGGSVTYTVNGTVSAAATGTLVNTATITSPDDTTPLNNTATDTDTITQSADLSITKTDGVTSYLPGGTVTYTITASNAGPSDVPSASITDALPSQVTGFNWICAGAGGGVCNASGMGAINETANLPAGGSVTFTVTATISGTATGSMTNTATVSGSPVNDSDPLNNSATDVDTLAPASVQFSAASYTEDESQTANIVITRTIDTSGSSTVEFSAAAGGGGVTAGASCATPGVDFVPVSNQLVTFIANDTEETVTVVICGGDTIQEVGENIALSLTSPSNAGLGTPNTSVLNINDTASQYLQSPVHTSIDMNLGSSANPYPSTITVTGAPMLIGSMRVTLYDVSHANSDNMDVLLVGPLGQKYLLNADTGGDLPVSEFAPVTLTFSDTASGHVSDAGAWLTGQYQPTVCGLPNTDFALPAPAGPYATPNCSTPNTASNSMYNTFGLTNPNAGGGVWSLYVRDDAGQLRPIGEAANSAVGRIRGGWGIEFLAPTAADVSIAGRVLTNTGRGIRGARITVTGNSLATPISVITGVNGRYTVPGLTPGETYIVTVGSRRFFFEQPSRVITLNDNVTDADFTGSTGTGREQ